MKLLKIKEHLDLKLYFGVLILLLVNFLFAPIAGGEEQYLGFTAQWNNPNWIIDSFSFTEFAGTRLIFQWLTAPFVEYLGIEWAAYVLRFINFAVLAMPLSLLLKRFSYSLVISVLALQCFFIMGQNLFGGEWIVKTYEPKSIAYIFVFYALYAFSISRYISTAVYLVLATYFHFLVGGWVLILLGVILLFERKWIPSIRALGLYFLLLSPFVFYLFQGYFGDVVIRENRTSDWIYCYYRLPHHTGIFQSYEFFLDHAITGVLFTFLVFLLTFSKGIFRYTQTERKLIQISFGINLLFVILAWVDGIYLDQKASFLIKYYPFRLNSLGLLFSSLVSIKTLYQIVVNNIRINTIVYALSLIILIISINSYHRSSTLSEDMEFDDIARQAMILTEPNSVFVLLDIPIYDGRNYRFPRLSRRDVLANFKFTPAESGKLYEWYDRVRAESKMIDNPELLEKYMPLYNFTHLVSKDILESERLELIYSNDTYKMYRIDD